MATTASFYTLKTKCTSWLRETANKQIYNVMSESGGALKEIKQSKRREWLEGVLLRPLLIISLSEKLILGRDPKRVRGWACPYLGKENTREKESQVQMPWERGVLGMLKAQQRDNVAGTEWARRSIVVHEITGKLHVVELWRLWWKFEILSVMGILTMRVFM